MAKLLEVVNAAGSLRDALFGMSERTSDVGRKHFILGRHLVLEKAVQDFAASPAGGSESPAYAGTVRACTDAAAVIDALDPEVGGAVGRAGTEADGAIASLAKVTQGATAAKASRWQLRGALRLGYGTPAVRTTGIAAEEGGGGRGRDAQGGDGGQLLTRLTKLFPAEAVSIYPAGAALLRGAEVPAWWFALVLAAVVGIVRWLATQPKGGGRSQPAAVTAAVLSFLLWVVMLGDWFLPIGDPSAATRAIAGALAFAWAWVAPLVVERFDGPEAQTEDAR